MERSIRDFEIERFQELWVFDGFFTKECDQIEARGPLGPPSPLGELGIGRATHRVDPA